MPATKPRINVGADIPPLMLNFSRKEDRVTPGGKVDTYQLINIALEQQREIIIQESDSLNVFYGYIAGFANWQLILQPSVDQFFNDQHIDINSELIIDESVVQLAEILE